MKIHSANFNQKKLEEQKIAIKNNDGDLVETEKEVKEVYTEFYQDILSTSVASTQKEQMAEDYVNNIFRLVLDLLTIEKVKKNEHQCGGQKGCGTIDNMIMMRSVIDNNRILNRKTYCYFADAYKCFDK